MLKMFYKKRLFISVVCETIMDWKHGCLTLVLSCKSPNQANLL